MNKKVFLDVSDHLVSHFGGRGRGGSWNFFFTFWILGFLEGGQRVPRSLKWAYACFFAFNFNFNVRGRWETLKTPQNQAGALQSRPPARSA
jgi:hypothetical protein